MKTTILKISIILFLFLIVVGIIYTYNNTTFTKKGFINKFFMEYPQNSPLSAEPDTLLGRAAEKRLKESIVYDPRYFEIDYPMGDVPSDRGVCTDVVIRAYRTLGIDLQELIHEDMKENFNLYPKIWRSFDPDPNIDHRRVPNLMTFFKRHGTVLAITYKSEDYKPGDIVCWDLGRSKTHIGLVSATKSEYNDNYLVVHNIGRGPKLEDCLFDWEIIGRFRYKPKIEEN